MTDVNLTAGQAHAITCSDAWLHASGLPTYTELLGLLEKHTRPLPAGQTITLEPRPEMPAGNELSEPGMTGGAIWLPLELPHDPGAAKFIEEWKADLKGRT